MRRSVYETVSFEVFCREWAPGCFIFDLLDKDKGTFNTSYSDNLKEATSHADFFTDTRMAARRAQ